jgi:hypothetical protein
VLEGVREAANQAESLASGNISMLAIICDNLNAMRQISRNLKGVVDSQSLSLYEARIENMIREAGTLIKAHQEADESFQEYINRFSS